MGLVDGSLGTCFGDSVQEGDSVAVLFGFEAASRWREVEASEPGETASCYECERFLVF